MIVAIEIYSYVHQADKSNKNLITTMLPVTERYLEYNIQLTFDCNWEGYLDNGNNGSKGGMSITRKGDGVSPTHTGSLFCLLIRGFLLDDCYEQT